MAVPYGLANVTAAARHPASTETVRSCRTAIFPSHRTRITRWKVRPLRWDGDGRSEFAELELLDELLPHLARLAK